MKIIKFTDHKNSFSFNRTMTILMVLIILFIAAGITELVWLCLSLKSGESYYENMRDRYFTVEKSEKLPASVNFRCRSHVNRDICGWLYCPDTEINYPVMYSENNIYAGRLPDKKKNLSGSLFIDKNCKSDLSSFDTVIYGKGSNSSVMFGGLVKYRRQEFFEAHPSMYLLTPEHDYRIDVFSAYRSSAYSVPEFLSESPSYEDREKFIKEIYGRSSIVSDITSDKVQKVVTLATWVTSHEGESFVVHGNLIMLH